MAQPENDTAEKGQAAFEGGLMGLERNAPNNTLQGTFDPLPTFAAAKAVIASNAPERER